MVEADLVIVGAGLAGSALAYCLGQAGLTGDTVVIEAGRGPGGRASSRRHRSDPRWRLDHGAPCLNFSAPPQGGLAEVLSHLKQQGVLVPDQSPVLAIDAQGQLVEPPCEPIRYAARPTMASVSEALLAADAAFHRSVFGCRLRWLDYSAGCWTLADVERTQIFRARTLILSGTLLAHPRSLAMLAWGETPLRSARPVGADPVLDQALEAIAGIDASIRWNLMMALPAAAAQGFGPQLPRQIWLDSTAQERWGVERVVLQLQLDGRLGLVVHGLDDGQSITPESQPKLLLRHEQRLMSALNTMLAPWPDVLALLPQARSLGVMRWGAAVPQGGGLPSSLQWCPESGIGFAGDWILDSGYGRAEGALRSAVTLADRLISEGF